MSLDAAEVFVRVAEAGSFTAAGKRLGMPKSTVSLRIAQLEARLGVTLIKRTTRRLQLTDEGQRYFETAKRSLADLAATEAMLRDGQAEPSGLLRIAGATNMGEGSIGDIIADFVMAFPNISVELVLGQRRVDLFAENIDLALRIGPLEDSASLMARHIGDVSRVLMAAPAYLERHRFSHPRDIPAADVIGFSGEPEVALHHATGMVHMLDSRGRLRANRMTAIRHQALKGLGVALLPTAFTTDSVGRALVPFLTEWRTTSSPVHVVYPRQGHLPSRARVFIDFLVAALKG
ncbi:LysR family transcriptional regulator [Devosia lacusdianchii]|uniref:LysR family transcriptional regulator n=1 Tax=Devosia lacusdianchii TaxID=2917991 RepID=UPI001F05FBDB|nr:LysR family transcriptional regulator [Devosia sp. JXJ CY 41]